MTDTTEPHPDTFDEWAIVELMGHRRLAGRVQEHTLAGAAFLRLDVPRPGGADMTQFYAPAAVYCVTPTTEDVARQVAATSYTEPVHRWELARSDGDVVVQVPDDDEDEWNPDDTWGPV